jgi:HAD superfamily hydrolase (TIGR01549 family)
MIEVVLFDLDNTLLGNDMALFLPRYFDLLGRYAQRYLDKDSFLKALLLSTRAMIANPDTAVSNHDVFWTSFQERTRLDPSELGPYFEHFYREHFPQLRSVTETRAIAADLVQLCFDQRVKVVIATNPLFPRIAIEERLVWAGVPVNRFAYDLVTSQENMHATKPNRAYYVEILARVGCPPGAALMVGDDWKNDIAPAAGVGLFTYWMTLDGQAAPEANVATSCGSLETLYDLVISGWLQQLGVPGESGSR